MEICQILCLDPALIIVMLFNKIILTVGFLIKFVKRLVINTMHQLLRLAFQVRQSVFDASCKVKESSPGPALKFRPP